MHFDKDSIFVGKEICALGSNCTRTQLDEKKKKTTKVENYSFTVRKIIKRKMDNKQDGRIESTFEYVDRKYSSGTQFRYQR